MGSVMQPVVMGGGDGLAATYGPPTTFGQANITSITIPSGVTVLSKDAFRDWSSLATVTMPDGLLTVGSYAFSGCTSLPSITIPSGVTSIGNSVFYGCTSLMEITIPSGVTSIGIYAFLGCTSLPSITIPSGVTSIDSYAFYGCTSLMEITSLTTTPPTIASSTFGNVPATCAIKVPAASVAAYQAATNWSDRSAYISAI